MGDGAWKNLELVLVGLQRDHCLTVLSAGGCQRAVDLPTEEGTRKGVSERRWGLPGTKRRGLDEAEEVAAIILSGASPAAIACPPGGLRCARESHCSLCDPGQDP